MTSYRVCEVACGVGELLTGFIVSLLDLLQLSFGVLHNDDAFYTVNTLMFKHEQNNSNNCSFKT